MTDSLDAAERLSREELAALQLNRLRASLQHAHDRVIFHRERFGRRGLRPEDCRTLADLRRYPFTTAADLAGAHPFGMLAVDLAQVVRLHSPGSGGPAVAHTRRDLDNWSALMARSLRAAGVRPGDLVQVAHGYGFDAGGLGVHCGAERLGCTVLAASDTAAERQVALIRELRPTVIAAAPSFLLALLDAFDRQDADPRAGVLRLAVLGGGPAPEKVRREIGERFGVDTVTGYGPPEVMGPGVAQECLETRDGPHIWEDHFLPEVVDPVSGAVLPDGERGELVLTTLTREAMPVVRYRTGHLTRLLPGTARAFRRMEPEDGADVPVREG
jgi:phenylacetate-CoA ligase